jgi:MYXO-CTERM domain-containing protein
VLPVSADSDAAGSNGWVGLLLLLLLLRDHFNEKNRRAETAQCR